MDESTMKETIRFEEGQPCPVSVSGTGGGLSFSPNGDMLLIGMFPSPSEAQARSSGALVFGPTICASMTMMSPA